MIHCFYIGTRWLDLSRLLHPQYSHFISIMRNLNFLSSTFPTVCKIIKHRFPNSSFSSTLNSILFKSLSNNSKLKTPITFCNFNRPAFIQGRSLCTSTTDSSAYFLRNSIFLKNSNFKRYASSNSAEQAKLRSRSILYYFLSLAIFMIGVAYAGAPLYRIFCQVHS